MLSKGGFGEKGMFIGKDLLIASAEVTEIA